MQASTSSQRAAVGRIVAPKEVCSRLGVSRMWLHRMRRDGLFPEPIRLSANRVGWPETVLDAWVSQKMQEAA